MIRNKKKGMALIWAVVICALLMLIATLVAGTIIKESQMTVRIDDSTIAYAAAESGVAWGTKYIDDYISNNGPGDPGAGPYTFSINKAKTEVTISTTTNADSTKTYSIQSTGTSGNTKRKIIQWYEGKALTAVSLSGLPYASSPQTAFSGTGSFIFQFDFWVDSTVNNYSFGLLNATNNGYLKLNYNPAGLLEFVSKTPSGAVATKSIVNTTGVGSTPVTQPYAVQVTISYIDNTSASITINERDAITNVVDSCTRKVSVDLTNVDMGNFTQLVFSPTSLSTVNNVGDGDVLKLGGATPNVAYVDNIVQKGLAGTALVNGSCGTANKTYAATDTSFGLDTFCTTGTAAPANPAFPAQGSSTNWACNGTGGGTNASCTASRLAPIQSVYKSDGVTSIGTFISYVGAATCANIVYNNGVYITQLTSYECGTDYPIWASDYFFGNSGCTGTPMIPQANTGFKIGATNYLSTGSLWGDWSRSRWSSVFSTCQNNVNSANQYYTANVAPAHLCGATGLPCTVR